MSFLDRQKFLAILYNRLSDRTKVYVNKEVTEIEHLGTAVQVRTSDGSCYKGNLVVGADGVNSKVRSEMWRFADESKPGLISREEKMGQS